MDDIFQRVYPSLRVVRETTYVYIEERAHRRAKGGRCTQLSLREEDFTRNRRASVPNVIVEQ
jgi:hypothetical protein